MGFFDAIKHVVSGAVHAVTHTATAAVTTASHVATNVVHLGSHLVHHASHAVSSAARGVEHLAIHAAHTVKHDAGAIIHTTEHVAGAAVHTIKHDAGAIVHGAQHAGSAALHAAADGAGWLGRQPVLNAVGHGLAAAGKWTWDHKVQVGMAIGTVALIAAIPLTGGASAVGAAALAEGAVATEGTVVVAGGGALAASEGAALVAEGGALTAAEGGGVAAAAEGASTVASAGRLAALGTRLAESGRAGEAAMNAARAGARLLKPAGNAVRAGRLAVGRQRWAPALMYTQRPAMMVGNAFGIANFGDQAQLIARGKGSVTGLALSTLGLVPLGGTAVQKLANGGVARAGTQAAEVVATKLGTVEHSAGRAGTIANELDDVVSVHPVGIAASKADEAAAGARSVQGRAASVLSNHVPTAAAAGPAALTRSLVNIENSANMALENIVVAKAAPAVPNAVADDLAGELTRARNVARDARIELQPLAQRANTYARTARVAETTSQKAGTTAATAGIANAARNIQVAHDRGNGTASNDVLGMIKTSLALMLDRNGRAVSAR